jgi:Trehalase
MDSSSRFLIKQPTGGELIEFLRVVELQAAAAQAGEILSRFAMVLGETNSLAEWRKIQQTYTAKTQTLWNGDWFYDFDTRIGHLITTAGRDVGQVAPVFCGVATEDQKNRMRPIMQKIYADSTNPRLAPTEDWRDELHWSSLVFPYLESLWVAGEREVAAQVIHTIAERIYTSMDRRSLQPKTDSSKPSAPKLGWPGVSCEVWGADGAYGGEGYGWGAVLPAHIIRSLIGFRDPGSPDQLPLSPNLPDPLMQAGKVYSVRNLQYAGNFLDLSIHALDAQRVRIEGRWSGSIRTEAVKETTGAEVALQQSGSVWQFDGLNHQQYLIRLTGVA